MLLSGPQNPPAPGAAEPTAREPSPGNTAENPDGATVASGCRAGSAGKGPRALIFLPFSSPSWEGQASPGRAAPETATVAAPGQREASLPLPAGARPIPARQRRHRPTARVLGAGYVAENPAGAASASGWLAGSPVDGPCSSFVPPFSPPSWEGQARPGRAAAEVAMACGARRETRRGRCRAADCPGGKVQHIPYHPPAANKTKRYNKLLKAASKAGHQRPFQNRSPRSRRRTERGSRQESGSSGGSSGAQGRRRSGRPPAAAPCPAGPAPGPGSPGGARAPRPERTERPAPAGTSAAPAPPLPPAGPAKLPSAPHGSHRRGPGSAAAARPPQSPRPPQQLPGRCQPGSRAGTFGAGTPAEEAPWNAAAQPDFNPANAARAGGSYS
ncbi:basic proline-rich protein-like [Motacilla alba alba]|uniref:basic proline-rich protein-like n=1 Tax=Motacilla alba alba TaxID=1094192 RepID=UPI0018D555F3|nr:basic proline-rich protein-like [Motacilla alba alba]